MATIACSKADCAFGKGGFCSKSVLFLNHGMCSEWVTKDGLWRQVPEYAVAGVQEAEGPDKTPDEAATPAS